MVNIGNRPILWHLMKYYAHFGHKEFILCLGNRGDRIKDYFLHYDESVSNDFVLSEGGMKIEYLNRDIDDWRITFVETGAGANVGERLSAVEPHLEGEDVFLANYGDGLSNAPLPEIIDAFLATDAVASLLLARPTASFDIVRAEDGPLVQEIRPLASTDIWINGGFFVMRRAIFEYLRQGEELVREPFQRLIRNRMLLSYKYTGFWQCMDTFKDQQELEALNNGSAPWKVWDHDGETRALPFQTHLIR
jgi:glucose-1-phosphate cytidylyltransferase